MLLNAVEPLSTRFPIPLPILRRGNGVFNVLRTSRGFSLIEVMVAAAIGAIVMAAAFSMIQPMMRLKNQLDANSGLLSISTYIRDCITNDSAWNRTIANNLASSTPTMACLQPCQIKYGQVMDPATCKTCTNLAGGPISLMASSTSTGGGAVVLQPCISGSGVNYDTSGANTVGSEELLGSFSFTNGDLVFTGADLAATAPEPSTYALCLGSIALLWAFARRRTLLS